MISEGFKKQLIVNYYNTQLLTDTYTVDKNSASAIKGTKNLLLFKIDKFFWGKSIWLKYKHNIIDDDIHWFSDYLTKPILLIYKYNGNEKFNIQKDILFYIKDILEIKQNIKDSPDYTKYMEDVYD